MPLRLTELMLEAAQQSCFMAQQVHQQRAYRPDALGLNGQPHQSSALSSTGSLKVFSNLLLLAGLLDDINFYLAYAGDQRVTENDMIRGVVGGSLRWRLRHCWRASIGQSF